MTIEEIIDVIIQELSNILAKDPATVRQELVNAGVTLPYDSIVLAEVLVAVEGIFGQQLPDDKGTANSLRSVTALARRFHELSEANA